MASIEPTDTIPSLKRAERSLRVIISGGGTGGHIYPALAVAQILAESYGAEILYIGDADGPEVKLAPAAGFRLKTIHAGKLVRYWSKELIQELANVPVGFFEARQIVHEFDPQAVFTSGGYVATPVGVAARAHGAPVLIHQQDVSPNLANKLLKPFATRISVSFHDSLRYFPPDKTTVSGNPVRKAILDAAQLSRAQAKQLSGFADDLPLIVVTGGSQGARRINQVVCEILPVILPKANVLHISGRQTFQETVERSVQALTSLPEDVRARYKLTPYLDNEMGAALAAADFVIARSGAATLAELAVLSRASILAPLPPGFSGSPQEINANMFADKGAAVVIPDDAFTAARLLQSALNLLENSAQVRAMETAAQQFSQPNAANDIAAQVARLGAEYRVQRRKDRARRVVERASRQ